MSLEAIAQLEKLVDQLLSERIQLQKRNHELAADCERLMQDRARVSSELDKLLCKLKRLEGKAQ